MFADVKNLLTEINKSITTVQAWGNKYFRVWNNYFRLMQLYLSGIADDVHTIVSTYFPPSPNFVQSTQWYNFWNTFREKSFDTVLIDTLLDVHNQIEDLTNPISENNKAEYDANIEKIKTDTVIGSAYDVKDGINNLYNNVANAEPTAVISVNTLPVKFYGMSFSAHTINIDFSWFAPYRDFTLSLWRFILWTGYIFLLFKRIPDIINGAGMITDTVSNANMTDGSESILHSITVGDDGSILSDIESKTVRDGNVTNRVTIRHDVSGNSTELRR